MSRHLLTIWDGLYQQKTGARYPIIGGKHGALCKWLRECYSDEDIVRFWTAYLAMNDPFFEQAGWSLEVFRASLPKVIAFANRKPRMVNREPLHWQRCDHQPKCATEFDCWLQKECQHSPQCLTLNECRELRHKEKAS